MDLAKVMEEIGDQLDTIDGLRVYRWPPESISVPAVIVGYPDSITFDETYGRGMDRMALPVVLVVGKPSNRGARDKLGPYCDGSGDQSIKAVLESGTYTSFDSIRVVSVEFDQIIVGTSNYVAAMFEVDIAGQGA